MGVILYAKCKCGYEKELWVDRGKLVEGPTCKVPALCETCNEIVKVNLNLKNIS